jgi:hypothetical protein
VAYPEEGAAKATAATEAKMRVLKKAIVDDWWLVVVEGWEASVIVVLLEWSDCWMMRRSWFSGLEVVVLIPLLALLAVYSSPFLSVLAICARLCCEAVVSL